MSSFIVSKGCMNNIISGLFNKHNFKNSYSNIYKRQNLNESKDYIRLANDLFKMNNRAVVQRYGRDDDYSKIEKFKDFNGHISIMQLLKSVQCLKYQCSEGEVPQEELFKWLNDLETCLAHYIVGNLPSYQEARWD